MHLNLADMSSTQVYFTLTQTLIPRPIAWVLSENGNDSLNLAPFSYFNAICSDPPLIMLSIGSKPDGNFKDTYTNIEQRDDFIVHIAGTDLVDAVNQSSITLPHGESELEQLDLELTSFENSRLPRILHCPVAYACKQFELQEIGNARQKLIFGEVTAIHIDDAVCERDDADRLKVDARKINPLLRLGAGEYASIGEVFSRKRPMD
jgi:flavin reductase (DIM6/NTAB) family NADH-FMN oxidoreductase RutF